MSRVGLPKVVTTTTSDLRTWKTNSSRPTIEISRTPMVNDEWISFHGLN